MLYRQCKPNGKPEASPYTAVYMYFENFESGYPDNARIPMTLQYKDRWGFDWSFMA